MKPYYRSAPYSVRRALIYFISSTLLALAHSQVIAEEEEEEEEDLVTEYLRVLIEPNGQITHAGNCPLKGGTDGDLKPRDISVLIEGACQGRVNEIMQLTSGSFEISVDVVGAKMHVVDLRGTTASKPMVITIPIAQ